MRKPDEIAFYAALQKEAKGRTFHSLPVDRIIGEICMNEKRAYNILVKWSYKGWWEWGVSPFRGWFTPEAPQHINMLERFP